MAVETVGILLATVALLLAIVYRYFTSTFDYFKKQGISGPPPTPAFGNWWGLWNKFIGEEDLKDVKKFGQIYGTFYGRMPCLMVTDPEVIKAVLQDKADHFRSRRASAMKCQQLKNSVLILEGEKPKESDGCVVAFTQERMKKLAPRILQTTDILTDKLKHSLEAAEGTVTVNNHVFEFLSNALASTVFGMDPKNSHLELFSTLLSHAFVNDYSESPLSALPVICPSWESMDKYILKQKAARYFIDLCIASVEEHDKLEKPIDGKLPDLVDLLLEASTENDDAKCKVEQIVPIQCLAVLLGASLTTHPIISLAISTLASKPEIQDRIHSELYKNLQTSGEISFDLVQNSEYLDMFVSEILRLYPLEFRLERMCTEMTEVGNVTIEKGTLVSIPIYALHHDEELYPESETFNPLRFSPENSELHESFIYLPFGQAGNKRSNICVQLPLLLAKLAIAALVKNFKFTPTEETKIPPEFQHGITCHLQPKDITVAAEIRK